ncbi:DUF2142 domain-containing protein [Clostridium septicum]|uniref:DUF2142 domain-containing protein n=2 Tax=Clostridium septicum TaxID=1504 RepID=A0ABY5B3V4_CLOSE|nr:DUF2142 domain-containing protein [Clostridium septicum]QAS60275.1 DUF2142 domain-containing protein [Clostridium septicum]UEC20470.1 DUF2142 domain-containing protein [Clostridium septicum]USS01474.1 DUF2142 domain-containing protein [Clostridium septicum]WLF70037.1 DUF2142 domain-containing protein [Clostridium septicum]
MQNINSDLRKKYIYRTIYGVIMLILMYKSIMHFKNLEAYKSKGFLLISVVLVGLMIISMITLTKFNSKSIEKQFLVVGLIWGMAFIFINPPYLVPDESVHIYRAYDIAKGRLFFKGSENNMMLPVGVKKYDKQLWDIINNGKGSKNYIQNINTPLEKDNLIKYDADATAAYNTIAYIPQSIGMFIGDLLNLSSYFIIILGRISNFLTWLALCYLALKYIPIKKDLLFLLMCIPMGMQQAASTSPDALLNSSSFLLIAYILYLKFEKEKVDYKDVGIIILLTIIIGSIKLPYIAIGGILILIPNNKMKFKSFGKIMLIILIAFSSLAVKSGWEKISAPKIENSVVMEDSSSQKNNVEEKKEVISLAGTAKNILKEPGLFINKIIYTFKQDRDFYKASFTAYFGWFKVLAPNWTINLILLMLFIFAIKGDEKFKFKIFDKIILILMSIGMYAALCGVSLQWKQVPVHQVDVLDGIQGRYFFPFIIGIYFVFQNTKLKLKLNEFWLNSYRNIYLCWTLMFSLAMMFQTYF